jgi:4-diphosphocytidyl-2-C-methyl-D-erythritol kinase
MSNGRSVTARAPAKVNLYLGVGPRRDDGYHDLATVFHALDLCDEVVAQPAEPGTVTVTLEGERTSGVPVDESNLAAQAAHVLARYVGIEAGVHLTVRKAIPVAGGLAGGSADAAAALVACDGLWDTGCGRAELTRLAARLGSDVPFALHGGTALGSGRGERLAPVMATGRLHWVLAVADDGLSTPTVYGELDRVRARGAVAEAPAPGPLPEVPTGLLTALRSGDPLALAPHLGNDLQEPALRLRPALARTLAAGRDLGALAGLVSGSGPTVVFLLPDAATAQRLARDLPATGACASAVAASGPAAGARVVAS